MSLDNKKPMKKKSKLTKRISENKTYLAGGIIAVVAVAGLITGINIYITPTEETIFIYGMDSNPNHPDPLRAPFRWDFFSQVIILQVMEGLFKTNYSNGKFETIHHLATRSEWSSDGLNFTCTLKQGVRFHDGTPFNAVAVKWNFDRIHKLVVNIGEYIWRLPDDSGWIINETKIIDEYSIRFVLNQPFAPLPSLFAAQLSVMVSPSSTPEDDFIWMISNDFVGTGPFMFDGYKENVSLTIARNPNYWGTKKAKVDKIKFKIIFDDSSRLEALISKELSMTFAGIPWSDTNRSMLENTPGITLEYTNSMLQNYIYLNTKKVNSTMRKAISYAFNYPSYIEEFALYNEKRCKSPLPVQLPYSNWEDFDVPYYNITKARKILIDASWNGTAGLTANSNLSIGNEWETLANGSSPLARYQFSYIDGGHFTETPFIPLKAALAQIGVNVEPEPLSGFEFFGRLFEYWGLNRSMLEEFYFGAYNPPYNDPNSLIHSLYSNEGINDNWAQVNDTLIQQWMIEAVQEINSTIREQLYYQIQKRLIEEIYPMLWIHAEQTVDAYLSNVRGVDTHTYFFKNVYFV